MHFGIGKSRDVTRRVETCLACREHGATRSSQEAQQARLARHEFRGVATTWTGVDTSTSLFERLFLKLM